MKERIRCLLLTFIIALVFCVNVSATEKTGAQLYYVTDEAGLLSENENMMLEKMAETVSQKYGIGVYIAVGVAGYGYGLFPAGHHRLYL